MTSADRRLLVAVVADLLDVLLGDDPAGPGGTGPVERHEVGPRLLEAEPDAPGIGRLHRRDLFLEGLGEDAPVALEGELHVLGGHDLAVVELHALAQHELVHEPVGRDAPGLRQTGRHALARHGLDERVMGCREDHERRALDALGRVEPGRHQRRMHGPGHLPFRGGLDRGGGDKSGEGDEQRGEELHDQPPLDPARQYVRAREKVNASHSSGSS